jgi:hypothetical protein
MGLQSESLGWLLLPMDFARLLLEFAGSLLQFVH